jgi:PAS domain S-box-containing protein
MDAWTIPPDAIGDGPGRWEQNYRTIFETSGSGMAVFDEDMTVSMVNREFERLTGYGREELLGRPWTEFVAPGDLERMNSCHARLRSHPGEAPGRYSLSLLDGKGGWREMSATVNLIPETGRIVASFFDVSELKRLNRALEDSERMYRLLADNVNDVIWTLDTTLRYTYVSPSVERIRGFRVEEMLNQPLRKFLAPSSVDTAEAFFFEELVTGGPDKDIRYRERTLEVEVINRSGATRWAELKITAFLNEDGFPRSFLGVSRDITQRRKAELALRESEDRYRAIVQDQMELVCRWRPDGTLTFVNDACCRYFGVSGETLLGQNFLMWLPEEVRWERKVRAAALGPGRPVEIVEHRIVDRNGEIRWIQWTDRVIPDRTGRGVEIQSVGRDMTERHKTEEALQKSERLLADIINFLPDATLAVDLEGKVIAWNRAIEEMTGVFAADILGKGDYEHALPFYGCRRPMLVDLVLHPDREIERHYTFLAREKDVLVVETDLPFVRGRNHCMWGKASPIYDQDGAIVGSIESIRDITERKRMENALIARERELDNKSRYLEEANTALNVLLKHIEKDKEEIRENMFVNIRKLLVPYLEKLGASSLSPEQRACLDITRSNLENITSPFLANMTVRHYNLTPREVEIARLIREGRTTKEIAGLLNLSARSVDFHRLNIRRKLKLPERKTNLRSTLLSFS